ncbi:MAG TPA: M20 peptidase family dipeptidase, partial [Stellaceae bacterium]|nr:M20 peptidase family dipeptidase [Stellaceae bacterium]
MSRAAAIAASQTYFDEGGFVADLARRVAIPTESQVEGSLPVLQSYLGDEIAPTLARLGFASTIFDNPVRGGPILIAERREDGA